MKALMVSGEASGDFYGGELSSVLRRRIPSLELAGMGGGRMEQAGVKLLYHYGDVAVIGVFEVGTKLLHLKKALSRIQHWVLENKPEFAVLIDFPGFNFRLARFLKKHRVKIFYFISPQIWAWRKKRVHFLKEHVQLMLSVLPFEKEFYKRVGVEVAYVGHPLVEMVQKEVAQEPVFARNLNPLIGIMPGSREVEVRRHLPVLLETISLIRQSLPIDSVLIWAPSLPMGKYNIPPDIRVEKRNRYAAMKACNLLLVASGTSTLEAAILNTPLFIVYRVGSFSWQLGKILVRVPYYGLVNWIAQRECIPEYIQSRMSPTLLATDAVSFLKDSQRIAAMKSDLAELVKLLGPPGAMERAADALLARLS